MVLHALLERIILSCRSFAIPFRGSLCNRLEPNSVRPNHLFDHHFDHDYFFELPFLRGAACPIIISVIYCTPRGFPGCPACEPNFFTCS